MTPTPSPQAARVSPRGDWWCSGWAEQGQHQQPTLIQLLLQQGGHLHPGQVLHSEGPCLGKPHTQCGVPHFLLLLIPHFLHLSPCSSRHSAILSSCSSHHPAPPITLLLPSPCSSRHPAPPITLLLLSPCSSRHPAPPVTLLLPSPCSSRHPAPPITLLLPSPCSSRHPAPPITLLLPSLCSSHHPAPPVTLLLPSPQEGRQYWLTRFVAHSLEWLLAVYKMVEMHAADGECAVALATHIASRMTAT